MQIKKMSQNKKIIGIVALATVVGIGGFAVASQRFDGALGASIASVNTNAAVDTNVVIETALIGYRQGLSDTNSDINNFKQISRLYINGVYDDASEPTKVWFEYNTNKNFPLLTQRIINLGYLNKNFGTTDSKGFASEVEVQNVFNESTRYFGRFVVQTKKGFVRYNIGEFNTPSKCTVQVVSQENKSTLRAGNNQLLGSYNIKNNCNQDVAISQFSLFSNVNFSSRTTNLNNIKFCSEVSNYPCLTTSQRNVSKLYDLMHFSVENSGTIKIPKGQSMNFSLKGDVNGVINKGDRLIFEQAHKPWFLTSYVDLKNTMIPVVIMVDGKFPTLISDIKESAFYK